MVGSHNEGGLLLRTIIEGRAEGNKTRGRQNMTSLDWMMEIAR